MAPGTMSRSGSSEFRLPSGSSEFRLPSGSSEFRRPSESRRASSCRLNVRAATPPFGSHPPADPPDLAHLPARLAKLLVKPPCHHQHPQQAGRASRQQAANSPPTPSASPPPAHGTFTSAATTASTSTSVDSLVAAASSSVTSGAHTNPEQLVTALLTHEDSCTGSWSILWAAPPASSHSLHRAAAQPATLRPAALSQTSSLLATTQPPTPHAAAPSPTPSLRHPAAPPPTPSPVAACPSCNTVAACPCCNKASASGNGNSSTSDSTNGSRSSSRFSSSNDSGSYYRYCSSNDSGSYYNPQLCHWEPDASPRGMQGTPVGSEDTTHSRAVCMYITELGCGDLTSSWDQHMPAIPLPSRTLAAGAPYDLSWAVAAAAAAAAAADSSHGKPTRAACMNAGAAAAGNQGQATLWLPAAQRRPERVAASQQVFDPTIGDLALLDCPLVQQLMFDASPWR